MFATVGRQIQSAVLLSPFLPFSSEKVCKWLNINNKWEKQTVPVGFPLPEVEILFRGIDKKVIAIETEKLIHLVCYKEKSSKLEYHFTIFLRTISHGGTLDNLRF